MEHTELNLLLDWEFSKASQHLHWGLVASLFFWLSLAHMQTCLTIRLPVHSLNMQSKVKTDQNMKNEPTVMWLHPTFNLTLVSIRMCFVPRRTEDASVLIQKRTQPLVSSGLSKSIPSHRDSFKEKRKCHWLSQMNASQQQNPIWGH